MRIEENTKCANEWMNEWMNMAFFAMHHPIPLPSPSPRISPFLGPSHHLVWPQCQYSRSHCGQNAGMGRCEEQYVPSSSSSECIQNESDKKKKIRKCTKFFFLLFTHHPCLVGFGNCFPSQKWSLLRLLTTICYIWSHHLECVQYVLLSHGCDPASIRVGVDVAMMGAGRSQQTNKITTHNSFQQDNNTTPRLWEVMHHLLSFWQWRWHFLSPLTSPCSTLHRSLECPPSSALSPEPQKMATIRGGLCTVMTKWGWWRGGHFSKQSHHHHNQSLYHEHHLCSTHPHLKSPPEMIKCVYSPSQSNMYLLISSWMCPYMVLFSCTPWYWTTI